MKIYSNKKTIKKSINKLDKIDENNIYIETVIDNKHKYNSFNQINIIDKLYEYYVSFIKFILNYKN
jgi:hypothetical protein